MNTERINRIFTSKMFYIVFSFVVSITLWMYVEISENEIQTHIVSNIRIIRKYEDLLNDRGLLVASMTPETIIATFECSHSDAAKLNRESLTFVIDLSHITSVGHYSIKPDIENTSDVDLSSIEFSQSVDQILLSVDRIETALVPVEAIYSGGTAEGFIQDPVEFSPQTITVSGPSEIVALVEKARVSVIRENLSSTYSDELPIVLLDKEGEPLDVMLRNQLAISDNSIRVTVPIRVTKEIALTIETSQSPGSAGAIPQNTNITISPSTITVAGNPDDLRDFNSINLGTIDLTRFDLTNTYTYAIALPNIYTNIFGETEAHIKVEISGLEIVHFNISNIQAGNIPSGYTVEIRTQSIDVRIRGRAEDLIDLTEENIRVLASLPTELSTGTQQVSARVIIDGIDADIGAVGSYFVTMFIIRD